MVAGARTAPRVGWLRDPDLLTRVSDGVLDDESVRLLSKSWGDALSVDDVALLEFAFQGHFSRFTNMANNF